MNQNEKGLELSILSKTKLFPQAYWNLGYIAHLISPLDVHIKTELNQNLSFLLAPFLT